MTPVRVVASFLCAFLAIASSGSFASAAPSIFGRPFYVTTRGTAPAQRSNGKAITLSNQAQKALLNNDFAQAESLLNESLSIEPDLALAHNNIGYLYNKTGRATEAIGHLEFAASHMPEEPATLINLGAAYQTSGNLPQALTIYKTFLSRFPSNGQARFVSALVTSLEREAAHSSSTAQSFHTSAPLHWAKANGKIRFYIAPIAGKEATRFEQSILQSLTEWESAGVIKFELVQNATDADIECYVVGDASQLSSPAEGGEALSRHRGPLITKSVVKLLNHEPNAGRAWLPTELQNLCVHEIGHALGIQEHSKSAEDAMYCTIHPRANDTVLSANDANTLRELYGFAPQVVTAQR